MWKQVVVLCGMALYGCTGRFTQGTAGGGEQWFTESSDSGAATPHMRAVLAFRQSPIVKEKSCLSCHTIGDQGGTVGPILDQLANRRDEAWLRRWLKDPNQVKPGTKMPNFEFTDGEVDELMGYILKLKKPIPTDEILASGDDAAAKGERLLDAYGCLACHRIGDEGRFIGVDLTWIGHRKSEAWERRWLQAPEAWKPGTFMPNFHLSDEEVAALAAYLHTLQGQNNAASRGWEIRSLFFMGGSPEVAGEMVYNRLGCWGCHGVKGRGGDKNPNAAPNERIPDLWGVKNRLSEGDIRAAIASGSTPQRVDPDATAPPFACPPWGDRITPQELNRLIAYINTLAPKERKWKFQ